MKVSPKDIELSGMKHAKETIAALLNVQADLITAMNTVSRGITPDLDTKDCEYLRSIIEQAIRAA